MHPISHPRLKRASFLPLKTSRATRSISNSWALSFTTIGFFYAIGDGEEAGGSGEVTILEVTEFDEDGQPAAFELVMDDAIAAEVYEDFKVATKDLYDFQ